MRECVRFNVKRAACILYARVVIDVARERVIKKTCLRETEARGGSEGGKPSDNI